MFVLFQVPTYLDKQASSGQSSPAGEVDIVGKEDPKLTNSPKLNKPATPATTTSARSRSDSAYAPVAPAPLGSKFSRPEVSNRKHLEFSNILPNSICEP